MPELPLAKLFVLLFMMTGPLRVVPTFYSLSREMDSASLLRVARRAALFAAAGVLLAVFCGHSVLSSWGASPQALGHRDWIAPSLTALQALIGWPASPASQKPTAIICSVT